MKDRRLLPNPFHADVVTSADAAVPTDVPEIHRAPFELCKDAYEAVIREGSSLSVLLYGQAGCGKTHLLSRFRRWLNGEFETKPGIAPAALVAIRMDAAPNQIWRHIRRRFFTELTRRSADGRCALDGILERWGARHSGSVREALEAPDAGDIGLDLSKILEHFAAGNQPRLCRAWLAGDGLSDADLDLLNLSTLRNDEVDETFAEMNAKETVLSVVGLSRPSPVVFCFDQLEALEIAQREGQGFQLFSRMGAALMDRNSNVFMVSTILETFLRDLEDRSLVSDYQRIGKRLMDLQPLNLSEGKVLVAARLALMPELRGETPVPEGKIEAFYAERYGRSSPRRLIHEARRIFDEWRDGASAEPISVEEFLRSEFELRWANAGARSGPETADAILAHGLPVALELLDRKAEGTPGGLQTGEGPARTEVVFANQPSMQGLAASLRHLLNRRTPDRSLCLVRDQRLSISPSAVATHRRIRQIEEGGGRLVRVDAEALAALDAMRQLLTVATSGDLSANGDPVEATKVRAWLKQNMPQAVERFVGELLGSEQQAPESDALMELLRERKVMSVEEASEALGWNSGRVEEYARQYPMHLRWFGGSRPMVCLAVAAGPSREASHAG